MKHHTAPRSRFAAPGRLARRSPALFVALITFMAVACLLTLGRGTVHAPLPARVAIADVRHHLDGLARSPKLRWTRVSAAPIDGTLERVDLYRGSQIVAEFALDRRGRVAQESDFADQAVPYGDWIAYQPAVLAGLTALFVLMTAVWPLRRVRNLDVLAVVALVAPVVLMQHRYVSASVIASLPSLGYLLARSAWVGLRPSAGSVQLPCAPLFDVAFARIGALERVRILRILLFAVVVVFVLVGIASPRAVDVVYAVMEGATKVLHGVLPYGNLPGDVVHGDTYPILSYVAYVPVALLEPVRSTWDPVDAALAFGVLAALAGAGAVWRTMCAPRSRADGDTTALRATLAWLTFPALLIAVSSGTTDVLLAAMLAFALLLRHRAGGSTGWLTAAGWFKLAPFALLPIWLAPLRGRRLLSAVAAILTVSAAVLGMVIALGGTAGLSAMVRAVSFQASRGSPQSLWPALGIEGLQPLGQASVAALLSGATVRFARAPHLGAERTRVAAVSVAVLIAMQLTTNYWAFLYTIWIAPLLCVSLLVSHSSTREQHVRVHESELRPAAATA